MFSYDFFWMVWVHAKEGCDFFREDVFLDVVGSREGREGQRARRVGVIFL